MTPAGTVVYATDNEPGNKEMDKSLRELAAGADIFINDAQYTPEQLAGRSADARSDIYALGVVLYEMVVGRRPFVRQDPLDVVRDHLNTLPPPAWHLFDVDAYMVHNQPHGASRGRFMPRRCAATSLLSR